MCASHILAPHPTPRACDSELLPLILYLPPHPRACDSELLSLRAELRSALESALQHRLHVQELLGGLDAAVRKVHAEVQAVPMPPVPLLV